MKIQVTCSKCLTRFSVSEKYAGKKGPCPKCKATIQIPTVEDQVVIHAPEEFGPKDAEGRAILKPIEREEIPITRWGIIAVLVAIVAAVIAAIVVRGMGGIHWSLPVLGALLLAPPLVWSGYTFARDQELEAYEGRELVNRVAICSVLFVGLWLLYTWLPAYVMDYDSAGELPIAAVVVALAAMIGIGSLVSSITFELESIGGIIHAGFYFIATLLLALLSGIPLFKWN